MNFFALKMLVGDRAKYLGLIFAIAFSSMLMAHQVSIFAGVMQRTRSQIEAVHDAQVWVMDPRIEYFDENEPMSDRELTRVRGVPGVAWAVPMFKQAGRAHDVFPTSSSWVTTTTSSALRAPAGQALRPARAGSVIVDDIGCRMLWPGAALGRAANSR